MSRHRRGKRIGVHFVGRLRGKGGGGGQRGMRVEGGETSGQVDISKVAEMRKAPSCDSSVKLGLK
jgi:hypothetical protein